MNYIEEAVEKRKRLIQMHDLLGIHDCISCHYKTHELLERDEVEMWLHRCHCGELWT